MSTQETNLKAIADTIRWKEGSAASIHANAFADRILSLPYGAETTETVLPAASTQEEQLARIAAAIRVKEGSSGAIPASQFAERILALPEQHPSRLPDGYTELEYIQATGTQYIDTGISPSGSGLNGYTKVVMDVQPQTEEGAFYYYFGSYKIYSLNGKTYYANWSFYVAGTGNNIAVARSAQGSAPPTTTVKTGRVTERTVIVLDGPNDTASVGQDSVSLYNGQISYELFPSILLLARHHSNVSDVVSVNYPMPAKLFSAQIYESDTLVRDFVPCTDPSGTAGLYDLVNGNFYNSASESAFEAGPAA